MPYLRDFQLVLREHDPDVYRKLSEMWEPVELEIRRAIPSRFNFGGVGKIVLELGAQDRPLPPYRELLNVGLLHIRTLMRRNTLNCPLKNGAPKQSI